MGQTSPTARTRAETYYENAVIMYQAGDINRAMDYLGKGTHYVSDLNEPHHASNLTAVNSNHSAFEKYVDKNRTSYTISGNSFSSQIYNDAVSLSVGDLMYSAAKHAKDWLIWHKMKVHIQMQEINQYSMQLEQSHNISINLEKKWEFTKVILRYE